MKKKWLAAAMTVAMAAGMLAGCGQKELPAASGEQEGSQASKVEESSAEESDAVVESEEELTYPLDTDVELSIYVDSILDLAPEFADASESPLHTGLAENTGISIDWQFPAQGADRAVALNLLWQEKELPDIILGNLVTPASAVQWFADGVIYDLTDYLPKYAPDYWEYINKPENVDFLKSVSTADGRLYSVAGVRESTYNVTYCGPVIRQDWLDECGLEAPVTLEDWENVLVTFKEKYGATFGFVQGRFDGATGIASGTGAFASLISNYYVDENGKVQFGNAQPEWKEMLEVLHRWYDMDLIDKDFPTQDDTTVRSKVLNGSIGVSITAMSQLTNWGVDAEAEGTGANWVGFGYARTAPGEPTNIIQGTRSLYSGAGGAVIPTTCSEEELIMALKFLNYGYTEEGIMFYNFGTEGETYTLDENGDVQWTELITGDAGGFDVAAKKYTGVHSGQITVQKSRYVQMKNSKASGEAVYKWIENTEAQKYYLPTLVLAEEDNARLADLATPIDTYVAEMALKFVTGDESLDNFDQFVEELYSMGLQECLDIQQAACDSYMNR